MRIADSRALVTGANRGLGAHFVEGLIARGADKVYACARAPESLAPLLERQGDRVVPLQLDVTDPQSVEAAAARAGDCSLLINNAGRLEHRGVMEAGDLARLEREMAVNVYGLARMCLAFAPVIQGQGGGAIVNMLSVASLVSFPCFGSYSATKAAAMSLTHSLRYELKDKGIRVHGVYAGLIDTGMVDYVEADKADPREVIAATLDGIEAGTMDIDADQRARDVRVLLREDPEGLLRTSQERAAGFRATHPLA
ncbi:MAG: SDR family oxidoreductase [Pseudomonadota bacterium]